MKNEISLVTPISKDLLYVKIADSILELIEKNNLKPGDKLPAERELAAKFQTSRHSLREALRVLENQGVIESHMGSGTYVASVEQEGSLYLDTVKINYLEMLDIKTELEKYAVELIILKGENSRICELEKLLEIMEKAKKEGVFPFDIDKKFHFLIADLSGNKMLAQMIRKMIETFDEYCEILPQSVEHCMETLRWHREALEGIKTRNKYRVDRAYGEILALDKKVMIENSCRK